MQTRFASCWILACSALLLAALSTREAYARSCAAVTDCAKGFGCEPSGTASDGGPAGTCVSLPCQSDSDCGPGLSCYLDMGTYCTTTADGGTSCAPGSACVPQWDAPCTGNTDCGPGFTCSPGPKSWNCGKDQDASQPPYVTSMIVPCSDVPSLGPPGFDASSLPFCAVDSDCPSTWTCQCQMTCGGGSSLEATTDAGKASVDAGCTMACIPPNSDLLVGTCGGGGAAFGPENGGATTPPAASDAGTTPNATGRSDSPGTAGSSAARGGGCQTGTGDTTTGWALGAAVIFALTLRRGPRRRRRPAR
jgi:MYXO-CTERM domain-containing protein